MLFRSGTEAVGGVDGVEDFGALFGRDDDSDDIAFCVEVDIVGLFEFGKSCETGADDGTAASAVGFSGSHDLIGTASATAD